MKEIKFRAWDIKKKIMIIGAEHNIGDDSEDIEIAVAFDGTLRYCDQEMYYPSISGYDKPEKMGYILMQYTELKDKNGKEIFEGDVVKLYPYLNDKTEISEITFIRGAFCVFKGHVIGMYEKTMSDIEVLGNIHEATLEQLKEWGIE